MRAQLANRPWIEWRQVGLEVVKQCKSVVKAERLSRSLEVEEHNRLLQAHGLADLEQAPWPRQQAL
jgi:hypothetical protein